MAIKTAIQWCDSTVNPTKGCDGCEILDWCYAHKGTKRFGGKNPGFAKDFLVVELAPGRMADAAYTKVHASSVIVELAPGRMADAAAWSDLTSGDRADKPWLNGMPRSIFVGDMSDVFSAKVSFQYLSDEIIDNATSVLGQRHIWMLLIRLF